jgi:pimeloyl-ACP methyl ester carboxylesterase
MTKKANGATAFAVGLALTIGIGALRTATIRADGPPFNLRADARPLQLLEQGSWFLGGRMVYSEANYGAPSPPFGPGNISVDHVYIQYQIPVDQKYRYPVIMVHGGGHTGKTYETTPDGREGWFTSFARRGFSVFVVDDPNRGRACCEPTRISKARRDNLPGSSLPLTSLYSLQAAWTGFRFGPSYPTPNQGVQFPLEALDQYAAQWVLTYRDPEEIDKITAGLIAIIDHVGPCIVITHSQSGVPGRRAAAARSSLVKGLVALEGGNALPKGSPEEAALSKVPLLQVEGDFMTDQAKSNRRAITARLKEIGGDATTIVLPEIGLKGNTHMMMMDKTSEAVADVVEDWILDHVANVRGPYHPKTERRRVGVE